MYKHALQLCAAAALVFGGMGSAAEAQSARSLVRYFGQRFLDRDDYGRGRTTRSYRGYDYGDGSYYSQPSRSYQTYRQPGAYYGSNYYDDLELRRHYESRYGDLSYMDDVQFVEHLYREILQREPDDIGVDHWLRQLQWGMPRHIVMHQFETSRERRLLDQGWNSRGRGYAY
jgi:hypothetical protein